ncbi:uncharacterized protein SPSK_01035 [Sporothrix schenckii 1099-18]|uniref:Uncharacterized protein n=1 Tax=Sporothrix schenckii 1099-18 TaxID=1397361 RepID=A0A0F2LWK0_SPOSC|nr:uncharacterized protein SPSK_01035 [Sporothrix schenckii 1099-18]KJR81209.1 hypothetical protein SPSK_01035 [Sporothrix schenckii 1099-18]
MDSLRILPEAAWLAVRDAPDGFSNKSSGGFQFGANATHQQIQFISELRFAAAKSIRTSTIILAAFNAVAAFATACGILYDAYSSRRRNKRRYGAAVDRPKTSFIQTAEVFPLVISIGIAVQGIGFSVAQAQGLQSLLSIGCTLVSQFMLPAVFIVPYIQLVFGVEFAIRGLRKKPFPARGKYTTTVCLIVLGILLLTNFLVADFIRSPDFCFASLFWFVAIYSRGCFAVLLAIDIILVLCTAIIFVRLTRSIKIDISERISASRMVYYLALGILSNTLIIPFFFSLGFQYQQDDGGGQAISLSMVASVVAGVSGLMTGGLHLFLRSTTVSTIGPRGKSGEYERHRMKDRIRHYGGSEPDFQGHMMGPVGNGADLRRMLSDASLISGSVHDGKEDEAGMLVNRGPSPSYAITASRPNPLRSNAFYPLNMTSDSATAVSIQAPEPAQMSSASLTSSSAMLTASTRKLSFSPAATKSLVLLPATTYMPGTAKLVSASNNGRYDMSSLKPPPSMNNLTAGRHRRDSSMASSATVQIGLRLSNVEDFAPMDSQILDKKVYNLYMSGAGDAEAAAAAVPGKIEAEQQKVAAAVLTQKQEQQQPLQSSQMAPTRRPSPLSNLARLATKDSRDELASVEDASPVRDPVKDARMKTLPPVPHLQENVVTSDFSLTTREDALLRSQTLEPNGYNPDDDIFASGPRSSPSVYSQQRSPTKALLTTKLPSPRGVGFAPVSRSNSSAVRSTASTLRREASSASHTGVPGKTTSDWI